jgi:predicted DNA-binding protein YlxM (UPF0122 family)
MSEDFSISELAEKYSLSGAAIESVVEEAELMTLRESSRQAKLEYTSILDSLSTEMRKMGKPLLA